MNEGFIMGFLNKIVTAAKKLHDSLDKRIERINTYVYNWADKQNTQNRELRGLQQLINYTQTIIANTDDASKRAGLEAELAEYKKTYLSVSENGKKQVKQIVSVDAVKRYVRAPRPIFVRLKPAIPSGIASFLIGLGLYFGVAAAQPPHSQATVPEETKPIMRRYVDREVESSDTYHTRIQVAQRCVQGSANLWKTIQENKYTNPEFSRFIEEDQEGAKYTVAEQAKSAATSVEETTAAAVPSAENSLETRVQGSEDKKPAASRKVEPEKEKENTQQPEITTSTRRGTLYTKKRPGKPQHYFNVSAVDKFTDTPNPEQKCTDRDVLSQTSITNYPVGSKFRDPTHARPVSRCIGRRNGGLTLYVEDICRRYGGVAVNETNYVLKDKEGAVVSVSDSMDSILEEKVGYDSSKALAGRYAETDLANKYTANLEEFAQLYNSGKILPWNEETNPFAYGSIAEYVAAANAAGIQTRFNYEAATGTGGTEFIANAYQSEMKIKDIQEQYALEFNQNLSTGSLYRVLDDAGVKRRTNTAEKVAAKEKAQQEELRLAA